MANDPRFEVYPRKAHSPKDGRLEEFGWRFRAANGQISAIGGEGFTREEDAERAVGDFLESLDVFSWRPDEGVRPPILRTED